MENKRVAIEGIEDGMLAAVDVKLKDGTPVIRKNTELEGKHMNLLKAAGIPEIDVIISDQKLKPGTKYHISMFPESADTLSNARIMIVDDSKLMRLKLRKIVEEAGLSLVGEAENGIEAVDVAKKQEPTFITMDIEMPERNGISSIRPIHEVVPDAKIVMISSLGQEDLIIQSISAGAVDFIHKPFDPDKVKKVIINTILTDYPHL